MKEKKNPLKLCHKSIVAVTFERSRIFRIGILFYFTSLTNLIKFTLPLSKKKNKKEKEKKKKKCTYVVNQGAPQSGLVSALD